MRKKIKKLINRIPRMVTSPNHQCKCSESLSKISEELRLEREMGENNMRQISALKEALRECWRLTKACKSAPSVTKVVIEALSLPPSGKPLPIDKKG